MKTLRISTIIEEQRENVKQYRVPLSIFNSHIFSSRREAEVFVGNVNTFLNDKMHQLNDLTAQIYPEYRKCWPYFRHNKPKASIHFLDTERKCKNALDLVHHHFDRLFAPQNSTNYSGQTFSSLVKITIGLTDLCAALHTLQQARINGSEARVLLSYCHLLESIKTDLRTVTPAKMETYRKMREKPLTDEMDEEINLRLVK